MSDEDRKARRRAWSDKWRHSEKGRAWLQEYHRKLYRKNMVDPVRRAKMYAKHKKWRQSEKGRETTKRLRRARHLRIMSDSVLHQKKLEYQREYRRTHRENECARTREWYMKKRLDPEWCAARREKERIRKRLRRLAKKKERSRK
jgi:hypothetical protein